MVSMKRSPQLATLNRRDVCAGLAACIGALVIGGCGGDSGEAADAPTSDSTGATCGTGAPHVGMPPTFVLGKPVYVASKNVFIVRDASGLYALTARCTHQGVTVTARTSDFYCPGHGATFNLDGAVTKGPATKALQHYALCTLPNGHVGVDTTKPVVATERLVA